MPRKSKVTRSYCSACHGETDHDVVATRQKVEVDSDQQSYYWEETTTFDFVECRGCHNVTLRRSCLGPGDREPSVDYFPPAVSRRKPHWMAKALNIWLEQPNMQIRQVLGEVYSALFAGNNRLAMMGARLVVDLALNDKLGDCGGFAAKLEKAEKKGWITHLHRRILAAAVKAGHAAAHRGYRPDLQELEHVLDIVEHLVQTLYVLEGVADEIAKRTPPRDGAAPPVTRY